MKAPHHLLQQASEDALCDYFFYEAGGFRLSLCSYRLGESRPPEMPTREAFEQRLPAMPLAERKDTLDRLIAEAEKWYPRAVDAYSRAPYRVTVRVSGDNGPHVLEYINADRFLRQMGLLRMCSNCGRWQLHLDIGSSIGLCCAYRSLDG